MGTGNIGTGNTYALATFRWYRKAVAKGLADERDKLHSRGSWPPCGLAGRATLPMRRTYEKDVRFGGSLCEDVQ